MVHLLRKKALFALLMLVLVFLACEGGARVVFALLAGPRVLLYGTGAFRNEARALPSAVMQAVGYTPPSPEDTLGTYTKFRPRERKTDRDADGHAFHPAINALGFRGRDWSREKPPGTLRVAALGASSTFGYHDRDDETWPHFLELLLNEDPPGGAQVEVVNLGIPHLDSEQLLALFVAEALPLAPDVVVFYGGLNDCMDGVHTLTERRAGGRSLFGPVAAAARETFLLVTFVDSLLYYAGGFGFTADDLANQQAGKRERFLGNLARMREECARRGIGFVVVTQQSRSRLIAREELRGISYEEEAELVRRKLDETGSLKRREMIFLVHADLMSALRAWAERERVVLVDGIAALDGVRDGLLTYVHLSANANRRLAQAIVPAVRTALAGGAAAAAP